MESDLIALEEKLTQLIQYCQKIRNENLQLRQELAQAHSDARQLKANMQQAGERIQALLDKLPAEPQQDEEEEHG